MSNESKIWAYFKTHTKWTDYGIAGLMGNLKAESALMPNNVQNTYESKVGSDTEYTEKVDNGSYTLAQFQSDAAGYGLAQWTYYTRKVNLYTYAKSEGKSIGDLEMQCGFIVHEITTLYQAVHKVLLSAEDIYTASNAVLTQYECPANQGTAVQNVRAGYGTTIYNNNHGTTTTTATATVSADSSTKEQLQALIKQMSALVDAL